MAYFPEENKLLFPLPLYKNLSSFCGAMLYKAETGAKAEVLASVSLNRSHVSNLRLIVNQREHHFGPFDLRIIGNKIIHFAGLCQNLGDFTLSGLTEVQNYRT